MRIATGGLSHRQRSVSGYWAGVRATPLSYHTCSADCRCRHDHTNAIRRGRYNQISTGDLMAAVLCSTGRREARIYRIKSNSAEFRPGAPHTMAAECDRNWSLALGGRLVARSCGQWSLLYIYVVVVVVFQRCLPILTDSGGFD